VSSGTLNLAQPTNQCCGVVVSVTQIRCCCGVVVSVTRIQWYDEDKCFATAFSDGVVSLATKDSYIAPIIIDAHQVTSSDCSSWLDSVRHRT